jgi:hypothetical protein
MSDKRKDIKKRLKQNSDVQRDLESCYQQLLNLFRKNGAAKIQELVEERISDKNLVIPILGKALEVLNDIQNREKFNEFFKNFKKSIQSILPEDQVNLYRTSVKNFGKILTIVKKCEKDRSCLFSNPDEYI